MSILQPILSNITNNILEGVMEPFNYFIFTVKTDNTGASNNDQFTVPTVSGGTYDSYIDWGDGSEIEHITTYNDSGWTHTFAGGAGTYTIRIWGTFKGLKFNDGGDKLKLTNISQWGVFNSGDEESVFRGCGNLTITGTDIMDTAGLTILDGFFRDCSSITTIPNIGQWDVSNIVSMFGVFWNATIFNSNINNWDVSNVVNFRNFMISNTEYNQPMNNWNTSSANRMNAMLLNCLAFNQDISNFNFENITTASFMLNIGNTPLSTENYDALLLSMLSQTLSSGLIFSATASTWSFGFAGQARFDLLSVTGFASITDAGQADSTMGCWLNTHNSLKATANPSDGTGVTSWKDLSDNDNNADEATNPPVFKTGISNGEPMMLFDGADTRADIASDTAIDDLFDGRGYFVGAILPNSDGENDQGRIFSQSGGNCYLYLSDESGGSCRLSFYKDFSTTGGEWETTDLEITIGSINTVAVVYDSSDVSNDPVIYVNGVSVGITEVSTPVGTATSQSTITIGNAGLSNRTFDGYMGDLAFFKKTPTSQEISDDNDYLTTKYVP